jgi:hypothetical protein
VQDRLDAIFAVKTADYERELEAHRDQTDAFLEQVRQGGMTRQEIEMEQEQARLERLQEIADDEYATEEQRQAARFELLKSAKDAERILEEESAAAKLAIQEGMFSNLIGLMNSRSRAMFEIGKAAAISKAAVEGAQAIQSAFRSGMETGGPHAPIVAAAYAASAALNSANNISRIKSVSFGSKSQQSSGGGFAGGNVSGPGAGGDDGGGSSRIFNIQLAGQTQSTESVRALIELINEQVGNGAVLRVT